MANKYITSIAAAIITTVSVSYLIKKTKELNEKRTRQVKFIMNEIINNRIRSWTGEFEILYSDNIVRYIIYATNTSKIKVVDQSVNGDGVSPIVNSDEVINRNSRTSNNKGKTSDWDLNLIPRYHLYAIKYKTYDSGHKLCYEKIIYSSVNLQDVVEKYVCKTIVH